MTTERRLTAIWESVLKHKVGLRDNFFEIGGDSFLALHLAVEIELAFSKTLPTAVIFYLPTIERLAKFIENEESLPAACSLVPLQVEGTGPPIFVVHWTVRALVRHLGNERPIYGLSFGLVTQQQMTFPPSIEALAEHYIAEMRIVQATGPYTLLGYSAGGIVAYEMAQQLLRQGESIEFLGLVDTYTAQDWFDRGIRLPLRRQMLNALQLGPSEVYRSLEFWYLKPWFHKLFPYQSRERERSLAYSDFMMTTSNLWMSYVPKPYHGKVTFFKPTGILSVRNQRIAPEQFWLTINDQVEMHDVPGRHISMAFNNRCLRVLATKLRACLAAAPPPAVSAAPYFCPDAATIERSQLTAFTRYCEITMGRSLEDFDAFAVSDFRQFWNLFVTWSGLRYHGDPEPVCEGKAIESASFFPQLHLNYAENLLDGHADDPVVTLCHHDGGREALTRGELAREVMRWAAVLVRLGVEKGDRVVAIARNNIEVVIAALASAAVGAVFSSCPQDMAAFAILTRFMPLAAKVLLANVEPEPWDIGVSLRHRVTEVASLLPSLVAVVVLDDGDLPVGLGVPVHNITQLVRYWPIEDIHWTRYPFNHPLFILFSSGTTGAPKCIVHGTGGTLIEHLKEHRLHCDLRSGDKLFFQTSCGWMMWNWQLSALASGAQIVLYDGPLIGPQIMWRIVAEERVTVFGTSAAFLQLCQTAGYAPKRLDLSALRAILSTGSILYPQQYDWVKAQVKALALQSISGGTDMIGCFVLGNPNLAVWRGEAQCRSLGLDVRSLDGELVCANPFPSRPLGFFGDNGTRFHEAYFAQNEGLWTHGDLIEFTDHGGAVMHGRSDGVLNIRGIRFGPAEIYRILQDVAEVIDAMAIEQQVDAGRGWAQLVLLVVLHDGALLDEALCDRLRALLFARGSAAHVPAQIVQVVELPVTHSGKLSEAAARDALNGRPVRNRDALRNPGSLEAIAQIRG